MQNEIYHEYLEECKQEQVPIVLTAAEVMDILGVGKNTVYRLLNPKYLVRIPALSASQSLRSRLHRPFQ